MLIISTQIDLNGERWFFPYKKPEGSKKKFTPEEESLFKLRLLVASSESPEYRSRNALVPRAEPARIPTSTVNTQRWATSCISLCHWRGLLIPELVPF